MLYASTNPLAESIRHRHVGQMPPEKKFDAQIHLTISTDMLKRVDRWRAAQADVPNRSEAIRRLVDLGLSDDE
jgi:hypothetical protein